MVDYLIRKYDARRFRDFYSQCTPETFEADCRAIFEVDFDVLEADFWRDVAATSLSNSRP